MEFLVWSIEDGLSFFFFFRLILKSRGLGSFLIKDIYIIGRCGLNRVYLDLGERKRSMYSLV